MHTKPNVLLSPSPFVSERIISAHQAHPSRVRVDGNPRVDKILCADPEEFDLLESFRDQWGAKHVIGYFPTHRGLGLEQFEFFSGLNFPELNDCLERNNAIMLVKLHYCHRFEKNNLNLEGTRILFLNENDIQDVTMILPFIDILATDYSGIYYDFLVLNRPIIFSGFDLDRYVKEDHELYEDYNTATPGPKVRNWEEFIGCLDEILQGNDKFREKRESVVRNYHTFLDTRNCERVVRLTRQILGFDQ